MKKILVIIIIASFMYGKDFYNPNGRPGLLTLGIGTQNLGDLRLVEFKLPLANFLTISAELVGDLRNGIEIAGSHNGAISDENYYEWMTIRNQDKLVPNVKLQFHLPLYKIWSN